jgi:hypothetical protein
MSDTNRSKPDVTDTDKATIDMSPKAIEERLNKVWLLTVEEWAAKGIDITKWPMRKDVERLIRLKDK